MRGQAAIEYLMTYGWAILGIAIVLAILYVFLSPYLSVQQCSMQMGFSCDDPLPEIYVATDGKVHLNIRIHNHLTDKIKVVGLACTTAPPNTVEYDANTYGLSSPVEIPAGSYGDITNVICYDEKGNPIEMKPGENFKANIIMWYTTGKQIGTTSTPIKRVAKGVVMGTVMSS